MYYIFKHLSFCKAKLCYYVVIQDLRLSSDSIKQEIMKAKRTYTEEVNSLGGLFQLKLLLIQFHKLEQFSSHDLKLSCSGVKLKTLADAAQNYHTVLAENRKIFNELQELKGRCYYHLIILSLFFLCTMYGVHDFSSSFSFCRKHQSLLPDKTISTWTNGKRDNYRTY